MRDVFGHRQNRSPECVRVLSDPPSSELQGRRKEITDFGTIFCLVAVSHIEDSRTASVHDLVLRSNQFSRAPFVQSSQIAILTFSCF